MPSKNVVKVDGPNIYFHVYARGVNKQEVFLDEQDFNYFIQLFERYLSKEQSANRNGYVYPDYSSLLELLAFCLMNNHFHLLLHQQEKGAMTAFMRSLLTSYSRYFNLKYKRTGPLFESTYKASAINNNDYLEHISRYIHLNPRYWRRYPYSSLGNYVDNASSDWLKPEKITTLFKGKNDYLNFMLDYLDHKEMLKEIKYELANL